MNLKLFSLLSLLLHALTDTLPPDYASEEFVDVWRADGSACYHLEMIEDFEGSTTTEGYLSESTTRAGLKKEHYTSYQQLTATTLEDTSEQTFASLSTENSNLATTTEQTKADTKVEDVASTLSETAYTSTLSGKISRKSITATSTMDYNDRSSVPDTSATSDSIALTSTMSESSENYSSTLLQNELPASVSTEVFSTTPSYEELSSHKSDSKYSTLQTTSLTSTFDHPVKAGPTMSSETKERKRPAGTVEDTNTSTSMRKMTATQMISSTTAKSSDVDHSTTATSQELADKDTSTPTMSSRSKITAPTEATTESFGSTGSFGSSVAAKNHATTNSAKGTYLSSRKKVIAKDSMLSTVKITSPRADQETTRKPLTTPSFRTRKLMTSKKSAPTETAAESFGSSGTIVLTTTRKPVTKSSTTTTLLTTSTRMRSPKTSTVIQTGVSTKTTQTTGKTMSTKKQIRSTKHSSTTVPVSVLESTWNVESSTMDPACRLQCPTGWSFADGNCFKMITNGTRISYSLCLATCEAAGATLVGFFELIHPAVRNLLQNSTSTVFNTSVVFSNAYKSNVLRVQNYLYTHNLSMSPQENGSSWMSKRIDQPKNHSIVNWCMKPAYCQPFKCPMFEIIHLSQGIYQTGHLNEMQEVEEGAVVRLKCVERNADKAEWETKCGKRGYWIPHPTYGDCSRTWGLPRTIVDRPGYTKIMENCNECHPVGTLRCEEEGNGYQCVCRALYEGHHCELTPRWSEQWPKWKDPCGDLGQCTENFHSWYCKCHNANRTGPLCHFDRTNNMFNPFETDANVRQYFSPAMVSHLTIGSTWFISWHLWKVFRIEEAKRANDRIDWLHNLRYAAVGVRSILITMAGNPSVVDMDSPGRFCTWVALIWTSIAILYWHLAEAHSLLLLVRGVHLNSLRNVDGKPAIKLLMGYFLTPIALMVIWFASVRASWDKLITFGTNWSTLGSMEDQAYHEVCYMVAVLAAAIQIATIVITIMAEAERRVPNHALNRSICCFHYWKPKQTEVMDKAFRSSIPNVVCSLLVLVHSVASAFSFDRPDKKDYDWWTFFSGMLLSTCYFLHTRVLCYSEVWAWIVEISMVCLPPKWSPNIQPLTRFNREEVLQKRAPQRFEREKKEEEERKEREWEAAAEGDRVRRLEWLKRWPDCPPRLLPYIRQLGPEEIQLDNTWPFSPSEKDYFCRQERHQVLMNMAQYYFRDRLKRRHAPESSAFIAARELFGAQLHPRPQHLVEKQLKQFYKEFSEAAEKDDWLILGRDKQNMASFAKWDQMFHKGLEKLYKVFPHHDPRPPQYSEAMKLMEKSTTMWFYPYTDDLPTDIIIPTPYPLWTKWETFVESFKISTEEQLNEAISDELSQLSKHNQIWDCIYDNDDWVMALDEETKEKLRLEVQIKSGSEHENPRLLPLERINDRMWDQRRPGFIGPRRRMTRPTFNLWELSLEREYLEEKRQEYWNSLERRSFRAHLDAGLTEERKNPRFIKHWIFNNQPPPPLHEQRIKFQPHIDRTPF